MSEEQAVLEAPVDLFGTRGAERPQADAPRADPPGGSPAVADRPGVKPSADGLVRNRHGHVVRNPERMRDADGLTELQRAFVELELARAFDPSVPARKLQ